MRQELSRIIEIKTTEEALRFGKSATLRQIRLLKLTRAFCLRVAQSYPRDSISDLETALFFATQAQFMREALDAAGCAELG